jgi:membrane-associated phospholipid phosphatase
VFESREMREKYEERMTRKSIAALIFAVLWSFAIGFARLYVRVHSWNQIVYGW